MDVSSKGEKKKKNFLKFLTNGIDIVWLRGRKSVVRFNITESTGSSTADGMQLKYLDSATGPLAKKEYLLRKRNVSPEEVACQDKRLIRKRDLGSWWFMWELSYPNPIKLPKSFPNPDRKEILVIPQEIKSAKRTEKLVTIRSSCRVAIKCPSWFILLHAQAL